MIERAQIEWLLAKSWKPFPICVPSYKRWDRKENATLAKIIETCDDEIQKSTYVFVRPEQAEQYRESFRTVNIVELPEVGGLASTRQYIQDYVQGELKEPYFMDMDDDINELKYVWHDELGDHLSKAGEGDHSQIVRLGCAFARMAFEKDKCVLGNIHRVRFASNYPASQTAYVVNKGATPRQVTFVNARELARRGIRRNFGFDENGDDVGFVAEITKRHGDLFQIPCLAYSFVDDKLNSVIRNKDNIRTKATHTFERLQKYPMKGWLKATQTFDDGSFMFGDIDYRKYVKSANRPQKTVTIDEFVKWAREGRRK